MTARRFTGLALAAVIGALTTWCGTSTAWCEEGPSHHHHTTATTHQASRGGPGVQATGLTHVVAAVSAVQRETSSGDDFPVGGIAAVIPVTLSPQTYAVADIVFPATVGHANTALAHHSIDVLLI